MNQPNLTAITADGRYYVDTTDQQYDLIVIDAYRQPYIPFQLTTREFFESCRRHLTQNGVVVVNVGRAPGDYRLVDAVSGTLLAVFPEVYQEDTAHFLNTMVFATNQPTQPARWRQTSARTPRRTRRSWRAYSRRRRVPRHPSTTSRTYRSIPMTWRPSRGWSTTSSTAM